MMVTRDRYQSVFISYGGPDEGFALKISERLEAAGIETWVFCRDAIPGEKLHRVMSEGIRKHDRAVVICSKNSLDRSGVLNEIERGLEREAREGGSEIIIPVAIDDWVFEEWEPERADVADQLRSRVIAQFPNGDCESESSEKEFQKLCHALGKGPSASDLTKKPIPAKRPTLEFRPETRVRDIAKRTAGRSIRKTGFVVLKNTSNSTTVESVTVTVSRWKKLTTEESGAVDRKIMSNDAVRTDIHPEDEAEFKLFRFKVNGNHDYFVIGPFEGDENEVNLPFGKYEVLLTAHGKDLGRVEQRFLVHIEKSGVIDFRTV